MDIMIAGAGTVGYSLAQTLSRKHNIIVVDSTLQTLNRLEESIDILTLHGNIEDPKTFKRLHIEAIDLFIAVTDSDEANLLSTLIIDDVIKVKKKIIRLKNGYFSKSTVLEKLDIEEAVFPDDLTAEKFTSLLEFPKANNIKSFIQTENELISIKIACDEICDLQLSDLIQGSYVIIGIERDKSFFIPGEKERLQNDDLVYFFGKRRELEELSFSLNVKMPSSVKKVVIFGANTLAQKIAHALLGKGLEIKMIDKSREACKEASEFLQDRVTIINASYDEHHLFEAEGLKNADMLIAADSNDEKNIVKCMEAREYGIEKVVAVNNDKAYYNLMHSLGIIIVRGSKIGAFYAILEKIESSAVVTERHFCGGKGVLFMKQLYPQDTLTGKNTTIKLPDKAVLCHIRKEKIFALGDLSLFEEGDIIMVSANSQEEEKIQKWINTL